MSASLGETLLRVGLKAFIQSTPVGPIADLLGELAEPFSKAAWKWLSGKDPQARKACYDQLASLSPERAKAIVRAELRGTSLSETLKTDIEHYLMSVPAMTRQTVLRPNDGGRADTLLSQLPRNERDLVRILPLRPPR
ncbi:MAG: hypothetical protein AAF799_36610, partial [Myxococcota bacterium]